MAVITPIFANLTYIQRHYVGMVYAEFHSKWSRRKKSTGVNSFTLVSKG